MPVKVNIVKNLLPLAIQELFIVHKHLTGKENT